MVHTHDFPRDQGAARSVLGATPPPLPLGTRDPRQRTRSRESRRERHKSTRRALRAALLVSLLALALVLAVGAVYTTALRARATAASERVAAQDAELDRLRLELQGLREERDSLASGRLPGLIPLEYDRALPLEQQYVRNIIFTRTGTSAAPQYEYRLVLENGAAAPLRPAVRLLFFDARGIQVAESLVSDDSASGQPATAAWLQPGETRSYTAPLRLQREAEPRYFLLVAE
jgi:cell division protein FtsB